MGQNKFKTFIATSLLLLFLGFTAIPLLVQPSQNSSSILLSDLPEEDSNDAHSFSFLKIASLEVIEAWCNTSLTKINNTSYLDFFKTLHFPVPTIPPPEQFS